MDELNENRLFSSSLQAAATATRQTPTADIEETRITDPERLDKIVQLKQQIKDGSYRVDSAQVSRQIVAEHLDRGRTE